MSLIEKIDAVYNEHPYKVVGDVSTYSQYNEGWSDACDRLLVVLSEQKEQLTIGDKIRESNESLAQYLIDTSYSCEQCIFKCYDENLEIACAWGRKTTCKDGIVQYLNQPYTDR